MLVYAQFGKGLKIRTVEDKCWHWRVSLTKQTKYALNGSLDKRCNVLGPVFTTHADDSICRAVKTRQWH